MTLTCPECDHTFKLQKAIFRNLIECPECGQGFDWSKQLCGVCNHTQNDCTCKKDGRR